MTAREFSLAGLAAVATFLVATLVLVSTMIGGSSRHLEPEEPMCPTEDSCVADYQDGAWRIVQVTP